MGFKSWMSSKFYNGSSPEETEVSNNDMDFDWDDPAFLDWLGIDKKVKSMSVVTYFVCLKMLSETMGKLPIHLYQDTEDGKKRVRGESIIRLLKLRPNPYMTSSTFWSTLEMNRNHHGNSYAWIRWNRLTVDSLWIMPSEDVEIIIDDSGLFNQQNALWYRYTDRNTGRQYLFHSDDVLHFKTSHTFNGISGASVQDNLRMNLEGNLEAQRFMNNLYKDGLTAKAVVQYTGDLSPEKRRKLIKGIKEFASGSRNAGNMIPVPLGMQVQPLNVKLTDAQFLELKRYSALEIAAAFGVKPNQINDYVNSSYNSSEAQNLAFYTDTMLYPIKQYEEETTYKVLPTARIDNGFFFKFNVSVILRADTKTQAEALKTYVNNGIMKPNEARDKIDLEHDVDGNVLMANGNYIPLKDIGKQYQRGGEE